MWSSLCADADQANWCYKRTLRYYSTWEEEFRLPRMRSLLTAYLTLSKNGFCGRFCVQVCQGFWEFVTARVWTLKPKWERSHQFNLRIASETPYVDTIKEGISHVLYCESVELIPIAFSPEYSISCPGRSKLLNSANTKTSALLIRLIDLTLINKRWIEKPN